MTKELSDKLKEMAELCKDKENVVTTKELAEQLNTSPKVILENAKKCFPNKEFGQGKTIHWNKAEITVLLEQLKSNPKTNSSDFYVKSKSSVSTDLTPALKIHQAMLLMKEGYEEELAILEEKRKEQERRAEIAEGSLKRLSDAKGLKTVEEVAKILGYGKNNFFALLRGMKIFYKTNGINLPYQSYIDNNYFECKDENYRRGEEDFTYTRIYVTAKGLVWLEKQINAA